MRVYITRSLPVHWLVIDDQLDTYIVPAHFDGWSKRRRIPHLLPDAEPLPAGMETVAHEHMRIPR